MNQPVAVCRHKNRLSSFFMPKPRFLKPPKQASCKATAMYYFYKAHKMLSIALIYVKTSGILITNTDVSYVQLFTVVLSIVAF